MNFSATTEKASVYAYEIVRGVGKTSGLFRTTDEIQPAN
jgi:hypothetical protein